MSFTTCLLRFLPPFFYFASCDVSMISSFVSAAWDVDPGNIAGQKTAEPAVVVENAAPQTTQEQTEEQPTVVTAAETAEEGPAQARTGASTPARDDEATRTPPPSSVAEEGDRAPTPPPAEERRAPTPPREEASSPKGSPGRGKGPVIPVTTAGGSAEGEEAQATSDDKMEEIQGRPQDGRQHVFVWRQRGDHFIGHEELAETKEAARVECAAKRLVKEVKVSVLVFCPKCVCTVVCFSIHVIPAGRNENGEVPKEVSHAF